MKTFLLTFGWIVGVANVLAVIFFAYVGYGRKFERRRNFGVRKVGKSPALGAPYAPSRVFVCCEHDEECERRGVPCEHHWTRDGKWSCFYPDGCPPDGPGPCKLCK